ncbi:hypothetical protein SDC9_174391 [bioreactor metagenome]|uniref:Uncharacterized protein n=1 Tax=bioreactor metagenome TaxID=1076179 RepID=A0A645GJS1_9ZZZZ
MFVAGKGGLPQLHRMVARGLVVFRLEDQHPPILEAGIAVADDGGAERFFDQVVGEQRIVANAGAVEHVEHVFAIGGSQHALEAQFTDHLGRHVEALVFA